MERKLSLKGIVLDLCCQRSRIRNFIGKKPEFDSLLKFLTEKDYYNDEDLDIPSLKEIAKEIDCSYDKVRRQIKKIYDWVIEWELMQESPIKINERIINFVANGYENSMSINVKGLTSLPRKGERVSIPYFKELVGTDYFHVHEISHDFRDDKLETIIWLKIGSYNSYWELRKDQAIETNEISMFDSFKKDHEIKEMLNIRPFKAWG